MKGFIKELFEQGIHITCDNGNLKINHDGNLTDVIKENIRDNKEAILAFFNDNNTQDRYTSIESIAVQESYPLSSAQYRLWILSQFEGGSEAYNMPSSLFIKIENLEIFKKAIYAVIDRHEILRTVYKKDENDTLKQWVLTPEEVAVKIEKKDFTTIPNGQAAANKFIQEDAFKPFDLENGPLIRICLLQLTETDFIFYYNMHHIISDGWSLNILNRDLMLYYESFKNNSIPSLPVLKIQYKDYAAWQLGQSDEEVINDKLYWLDQFQGELPVLELPSSQLRPLIKTHNGHGLAADINAETVQKLRSYVKEEKGSLFIGLLTVLNILLYKYTAQKDIILGTVTAGRNHIDLKDQIGLYVNTLALRNQVNPEMSFHNLFQEVKKNTFTAYNHQMYSFDKLVEDLNQSIDLSRSPLFEILVSLQNIGDRQAKGVIKGKNEIQDLGTCPSKFDLSITFEEVGDGLSFFVIYNKDVYEMEMMKQFMNHFKSILEHVVNTPKLKLKDIDYLSLTEKNIIKNEFNANTLNYNLDEHVIALFQKQVAKTPNKIAVVYGNKTYSYKELDIVSNQFANYLKQEYTIKEGDLIGIRIPRDEWLLISILGIFKVGAAYVPMDINYPEERIQYIEKDSACKLIITSAMITNYKSNSDIIDNTIETSITANSVAYIIYTSGSTGVPKGVVLTHTNLTSFLNWSMEEFKNTDFDILYGATSHCFDLSVFEMFYPLCIGKTIRLLENGLVIPEYISKDEKILINTVPSVVSNLLKSQISFENVVALNMAGEPIPIVLSNALVQFPMEIRNLYGPSEDTTYSSCYKITNTHTHSLPIGKPVANTQFYIVSDTLLMQPIRVTGELCISGDGLAKYYLNQDELTKEKFIPNPFDAGKLMYKTGDLGYWMPDGNIGFIGRKDHQIKIRGYRVELGEIEHILEEEVNIERAVVLVKEIGGEKLLVSYLEGTTIDIEVVWDKLAKKLPNYMLPTHYCLLDKMLLLPNGKIAKNALLTLEIQPIKTSVYSAPTTEIERQVVEVWEEIFKTKHIGINDNFFELGGNSLSLIGLVNKLHKRFNCKIELQKIYSHRTVAKQALLVSEHKKSTYTEIERIEEKENYSVSLMQERLLLLSNMDGSATVYNMPTFIILNESVIIDDFKKAIHSVIERHEILRTTFKLDENGTFKQWIQPNEEVEFKIDIQDFRELSNANETAINYINLSNQKQFDLDKGPLLSASLLRISNNEYVFYYNMHHIISDGISMKILSQDTMNFYNAYVNKTSPDLLPLKIQYKDYAEWQRKRFENGDFDKNKSYWLSVFKENIPQLNLLFSAERPRIKTYNGSTISAKIEGETLNKFLALTKDTNTTIFMHLMYVYGIILNKHSNQKEFIIGSPVSVRVQEELSNQIGFYTNTLIYKILINKKDSYMHALAEFKNYVLENFEHREYPFDLLVENLNQGKDFSRNPLFDAMLVVNDQDGINSEVVQTTTSIAYKDEKVRSKFDITFAFEIYNDEINCNVVFNTDLYKKTSIENMLTDYMDLIALVVNDPSLTVNEYANTIMKDSDFQEHDSFFNEMMKDMNTSY
ncbi:non-ribosomal peptide synthetase [Flavobacterium sp. '19STA2R22 D10 B1']|uniref:non-ribosomal peptide synthetase n=1 Tax=Flavobacterium aerium TaxID=3037261 RepID=UPI00278C73C7|nr:non-ribosomal peptide synthetase [Flavobacterium sp. '19STA2R22 D10 B1']